MKKLLNVKLGDKRMRCTCVCVLKFFAFLVSLSVLFFVYSDRVSCRNGGIWGEP
jgi:hypothetical protein